MQKRKFAATATTKTFHFVAPGNYLFNQFSCTLKMTSPVVLNASRILIQIKRKYQHYLSIPSYLSRTYIKNRSTFKLIIILGHYYLLVHSVHQCKKKLKHLSLWQPGGLIYRFPALLLCACQCMWAQKIVFVKFLLNIFAKIDFNRRRKKCENREQSEDVEFLALMPILSVSRNTTFCAAVVFIIFFLLRKNFPQMPSSSKMKKNWRHMKALLDSQKFCFYRKQFEIWRQKFCFDPFLKFRNEQFNSMILFQFPVNWQNLIKKFILNLSSLLYFTDCR